ncbi:hypothetical protein V6N11_056737 [Hibiscus sabdariffa]|uniref:Uncharacterized protein n=1 Tax=Hibiscus sabdariffa TaxID=183260 RepID=A0ABR2T4Q7_9ROSI
MVEQPSEQDEEPVVAQTCDNTAGGGHGQEVNNDLAQNQEQTVEEEGVPEVVSEVVHTSSTGPVAKICSPIFNQAANFLSSHFIQSDCSTQNLEPSAR